MIPRLAPLFQGEWARYGAGVACPPRPAPAPGVSRRALASLTTQPACLRALLLRHARQLGLPGHDLRASASAWSLDYLWLVLPPSLAAACLLHHGLPLDPSGCLLDLAPHGAPICLHVPHEGTPLADDPACLEQTLIRAHLSPLFAALHLGSKLPVKILWGNAARVLAEVFRALSGAARAQQDDAPLHRIAALAQALLDSPTLRDGQPNPLWLYSKRGVPDRHAQCCLRHLLPAQAHCEACPLAPTAASAVRI